MISVFGGILLTLSGLCLMGRSSLLSYKNQTWPTAPSWLNWSLRVTGWIFCLYGPAIIFGYDHVSAGTVAIFAVICFNTVLQFTNLLFQRRNYYGRFIHSH